MFDLPPGAGLVLQHVLWIVPVSGLAGVLFVVWDVVSGGARVYPKLYARELERPRTIDVAQPGDPDARR